MTFFSFLVKTREITVVKMKKWKNPTLVPKMLVPDVFLALDAGSEVVLV